MLECILGGENMKKTLTFMMALAFLSSYGQCGSGQCGFSHSKQQTRQEIDFSEKTDRLVKNKKMTLLGKQFETEPETHTCGATRPETMAILFFDTDGNTNTTEIVGVKYCPCLSARAKVFDAKIGDTKTCGKWREFLAHRDEASCAPRPQKRKCEVGQYAHRLIWERVLE